MSKTLTLARKELWSYFASPTAFIFLGSYLLVNLFVFFWVEKFFSRNLADLRPLFEWMPILLVFLISTLTMKMWSEERRIGTVEFLLTLPIKTHELVLGKFLACMALVALALLLTLGLDLSVGVLGKVDWGPVFGAYLASLLLAAAYTAIGLFISSKTKSQIVSLLLTSLVCSAFYMVGSKLLDGFFGNKSGEFLKLLGSGSRFDSISRGVLDIRDVYFYLSVTAVFLTANTLSLEKLKWATEARKPKHTLINAFVYLVIGNVLAANLWLSSVSFARLDLTQSKMYSISKATLEVMDQLQEPLLLRGYFSERTHPLLAPLVPTIRDLLREYQLASRGKIRSEFIDPRENEEVEAEASRKYNIEPVPFQINDRHSASMVNSYFNVVVQYGNQHEVLGFNDLIEIKHDGMGQLDVRLRNLEYDITRSIKKVLQGFRNTDNFFAGLTHNVKFVGYVSEATLPKQLAKLNSEMKTSLQEYQKSSAGKLEVEFLDPSQDQTLAKTLAEKYGLMPQSMNLFAQSTFYFYPTLQDGDKVYMLGVPDDLSVTGFKNSLESTLKRMAPGFMRNVGLYTPPGGSEDPMMAQFGGGGGSGRKFKALQQKLGENYNTSSVDLESGHISSDVDILLLLAPKDLKEKQIFAIDQFLMKGGTVVLATSKVGVTRQQQSFSAEEYVSNLDPWLAHHGISIPKELVLDEQNSGFPALRKRVVQGITIKEPYLAPYPFFVDVRSQGLNAEQAISSGLSQLTMAWPSPIDLDDAKNKDRSVVTLVKSSSKSWRSTDTNIEGDRNLYPELGFAVSQDKKPSTMAVMVEGHFDSFFKGKESPLLKKDSPSPEAKEGEDKKDKDKKEEDLVSSVIEKSPAISRLIVMSSNEFLTDEALQISSMVNGAQYLTPLQLVENALDWSTQDRALLSIRSRSHFARTLEPMSETQKRNWEIANYVMALLGLAAVFSVYRYRQKRALQSLQRMNLQSSN
ncbi:MAG: Gldg family protein [Oligoflexales bacterium]|nr:Gldg family protein [Oligoflexales bacterium]